MALKPKEEIGAEVHKLDQFFRVEEGAGEAIVDSVRTAIRAGFAVVVIANCTNRLATLPTLFPRGYQNCATDRPDRPEVRRAVQYLAHRGESSLV
jgi:Cupin domain